MRDECLSSRSAFPVVSPPKDGGVQCLGARCVCLDDDLARMRSLLVGVFAPLSLSLCPRRDSCNRFTYLSLYFSSILSAFPVGVRPPLAQSIAYRHRDRLVGIIVIPGPGIPVDTRRQCSFGWRDKRGIQGAA